MEFCTFSPHFSHFFPGLPPFGPAVSGRHGVAALERPRRRHLRGDGLWAAAVWGGHGADQRRDVAGVGGWDGMVGVAAVDHGGQKIMTPLLENLLG